MDKLFLFCLNLTLLTVEYVLWTCDIVDYVLLYCDIVEYVFLFWMLEYMTFATKLVYAFNR